MQFFGAAFLLALFLAFLTCVEAERYEERSNQAPEHVEGHFPPGYDIHDEADRYRDQLGQAKKPDVALGIDLGTTFTCAYVCYKSPGAKNGVMLESVVLDKESPDQDVMPSVVRYYSIKDRWVLVPGYQAYKSNAMRPDAGNYFYAFKRLMGRSSFKDDEVLKEIRDKVTYQLEEVRSRGPNNEDMYTMYMLHLDENANIVNRFTAVEASARILQTVKNKVEEKYNIVSCIVTVPAYFSESQRNATKVAASVAGFKNFQLRLEPDAAAYAYQMKQGLGGAGSKFVVFDLGGGTMDISALEYDDGILHVQRNAGDNFLGGENINDILFDYFKREIERGSNRNKESLGSETTRLRLRRFVEEVKIGLCNKINEERRRGRDTSEDVVMYGKDFFIGDSNIPLTLTESKFNDLVIPFLERIALRLSDKDDRGIVYKMKDFQWDPKKVDYILFVGGSSRVPIVRDLVAKVFPNSRLKFDIDPDRIVAEGAAYVAAKLAGFITGESLVTLNSVPLPIGIKVHRNQFYAILKEGATIPAINTETFTTESDFQSSVMIEIAEGGRPRFYDNEILGRFEFKIDKSAPRGEPEIEITVHWTESGDILLDVLDVKTGNKANKVLVKADAQLTPEKIEELRKNAAANEAKDKIAREIISLRNTFSEEVRDLKRIVAAVKNGLITEENKSALNREIYSAETWIDKNGDDVDLFELRERYNEFHNSIDNFLPDELKRARAERAKKMAREEEAARAGKMAGEEKIVDGMPEVIRDEL